MDGGRGRWLLFLATLTLGVIVPSRCQQCQCEDLGQDHFCSRISNGTNRYVKLPNYLGIHSLGQARYMFETVLGLQHQPLGSCYKYVDEYLCALFFPVCKSTREGDCQRLGPCRELCRTAENDCRAKFDEIKAMLPPDFDIPEVNCSSLPAFQHVTGGCVIHIDGPVTRASPTSEPSPAGSVCASPRACTGGLVPRAGFAFAGISNCAESCPGAYTSDADNVFATAWLSVWSVLCLLFSAGTIVNWSVSYKAYHYPQRPILHIAICYAAISATYIIALAAGNESVCYPVDESSGANSSGVAEGRFSTAPCVLTFVVGYFFTVASWCWWIIIAFTWFLQAPLKLQGSATEMRGFQIIYHMLAWGLPLLLTIIATATQSYGANSITRLCQISVHNSAAQVGFIVVPQLLCVVVCIALLLCGHLKLLISTENGKKSNEQPSSPPAQQQGKSTKDWSMADLIKADVFCVLFLVQMSVSSSINMYHFRSFAEWEEYHVACDRCGQCSDPEVRPLFGIFIFKLTFELFIGCLFLLWLKPMAVLSGWKAVFKCFLKSDSQRMTTPSTPTTPTWSQTSV